MVRKSKGGMTTSRLVVVSNRVALPDDEKSSAGDLAISTLGAPRATGSLWFDWNGEIGSDQQPLKQVSRRNISWASFSLNERDRDEYYNQFSSAVLWPVFHYHLGPISFQHEARRGYLRVSAILVDKLLPLIEPGDTLWIHDYYLLPFASELCKCGVNSRISLFLHIPFSTPEIFNMLPPRAELLEQLYSYDLLDFQTESDRIALFDSITMQTRLSDLGDKRY